MDKILKIKAEIVRLKENLECEAKNSNSVSSSIVLAGKMSMLDELHYFIDSMQKEPASDEMETSIIEYMNHTPENDPELSTTLYTYEQMQAIARHFANWQKQQLTKDAVSGYIYRARYTKKNVLSDFDVTCEAVQKFKHGDKVKVIILKDE